MSVAATRRPFSSHHMTQGWSGFVSSTNGIRIDWGPAHAAWRK